MIIAVAILTIIGICAADTSINYDHNEALETGVLAYTAWCDASKIGQMQLNFAHPLLESSDVLSNFQFGQIITSDHLQVYTGYDPVNERHVISFRGSANMDNYVNTNFDAIPESYPFASQLSDPKIHPGFYDAFKVLERRGLRDAIIEMFAEEGDVLVTGHSLGGALATVTSLELKQNPVYQALPIGRVDVITYGSPRVVNEPLAVLYNEIMDSSWRVVYRYDPAVTVPIKAMGYYHVATEVWYNYQRWWWQMDPLSYKICDGTGEDPECYGTDFWVDRLPVINHHLEYFGIVDFSIVEHVSQGGSSAIEELCNQKDE